MRVERFIGWIGFALVIVSYALVSFGYMSASGTVFLLCNALGAAFLCYVSLVKKAYQPFVIYIVWTIISLIGLL